MEPQLLLACHRRAGCCRVAEGSAGATALPDTGFWQPAHIRRAAGVSPCGGQLEHSAVGVGGAESGWWCPKCPPAPPHVLLCFFQRHLAGQGENLDMQDESSAAGCSRGPLTGLNADLVPKVHLFLQIGVGEVFVKDLAFILTSVRNLGWRRDLGQRWLPLKLLFMFLAHFPIWSIRVIIF